MSKDSIVFYHEWLPLIDSLSNDNKLKFYDLLFNLDEDNSPEIDDPHLKSVFDYVANKVLVNNKKYQEKCDKARKSANARWNKRNNANACERKKRIKTHYDNVNDNDNDNDIISNEIIIKKNTNVFQKPTLEEVKNYCLERQNSVDAEKWLDHYQSNGWKVGKNSMKDWKAAVRTWEKSRFDSNPKQKASKNQKALQKFIGVANG